MKKCAILILAALVLLPAVSSLLKASNDSNSIFSGIVVPTENVWTYDSFKPLGKNNKFHSDHEEVLDGILGTVTQAKFFKGLANADPAIYAYLHEENGSAVSYSDADGNSWTSSTSTGSDQAGYYSFSLKFEVDDPLTACLSGIFKVHGTLVGIIVNDKLIYDIMDSVVDVAGLVSGVDVVNDNGNTAITQGSFIGDTDTINTWKNLLNAEGDNTLTFIVANHSQKENFNPYPQAGGGGTANWGGATFAGINVGELPRPNIDDGLSGQEENPDPTATPEPATLVILACGMLGGGLAMRRRKN